MCDIDAIVEPRKPLTEEEIQCLVDEITDLSEKEKKSRFLSTEDDLTSDEINSHMEDAYLAYLIMVRRAKRLSEEMFLKYGLDAIFDCTYEELEIPDFEDYLIQ